MAKTILFFADGTWNGPGEDAGGQVTGTNVFKLFAALEGVDGAESLCCANEQERATQDAQQAAKYLHGVGDSRNWLVRGLGGAVGAGLIARIVRGYTFLSRAYEPGARIILAGFSRGAYTVRALAGLVAEHGLLDRRALDLDGDRERAYRLGAAVWLKHQRETCGFLANLELLMEDWPAFLQKVPAPGEMVAAPVEGVAVWDTVGSLGIPAFAADGERLDLFRFADTRLNPRVAWGLHAVAVDERRRDFQPTLWDADPRILQVLFPGAHSDVGGGYGETGLSDAALIWMAAALAGKGVRFRSLPAASPDPRGPAHQPWTHFPFDHLGVQARVFPPGLVLHRSVLDRLAGGPCVPEPGLAAGPYAPANLEGYLLDGGAAPGVAVAD